MHLCTPKHMLGFNLKRSMFSINNMSLILSVGNHAARDTVTSSHTYLSLSLAYSVH